MCSGLFKAELQASAQKDEDMALQGGRGGGCCRRGLGVVELLAGRACGGCEMRVFVAERRGGCGGGGEQWAAVAAAVGVGDDGKKRATGGGIGACGVATARGTR